MSYRRPDTGGTSSRFNLAPGAWTPWLPEIGDKVRVHGVGEHAPDALRRLVGTEVKVTKRCGLGRIEIEASDGFRFKLHIRYLERAHG